ncbi:MAG: amidohydrolase family protein, partial [Gemmatimonadota bacterium]
HLCSVGFREAVALGIDNLEHGFITNSEYTPGKRPDECPPNFREALTEVDMEGEEVRATIREMVENDVALTTTPAVYELFVPNRPPLEGRVLDAMSEGAREEYLESRRAIAENGQGIPEELLFNSLTFDRMVYEAGGLLAAGVDPTGNGGALFGYGDQRNYELLVEGGFEPVEAIRVLTLNGARVLEMDDDIGSIAPGKAADIVVIDGDPIERPAEIRNVHFVFKDGVGYDSAALIEAVQGQVGIR